jgi:hypothetical protein
MGWTDEQVGVLAQEFIVEHGLSEEFLEHLQTEEAIDEITNGSKQLKTGRKSQHCSFQHRVKRDDDAEVGFFRHIERIEREW